MVIKTKVSKSMSLDGWSWQEWWSRNKDTIKNLGVVGLAISGYFIAKQQNTEALYTMISAVIAAIMKLGFDTLDYFMSIVDYKTKE